MLHAIAPLKHRTLCHLGSEDWPCRRSRQPEVLRNLGFSPHPTQTPEPILARMQPASNQSIAERNKARCFSRVVEMLPACMPPFNSLSAKLGWHAEMVHGADSARLAQYASRALIPSKKACSGRAYHIAYRLTNDCGCVWSARAGCL